MKDTITVAEIFGTTLQGEGALVGRQTVFVRTGGCDFRCSWCDSLHAVLMKHRQQWDEVSAEHVLARVMALTFGRPILITLSGGNPALQPLAPLIDLGREHGFTFALETQGSIAKPWFHKLDHLILSPKPPSSGMRFRPSRLQDCLDAARVRRFIRRDDEPETEISLKVVVLTEEDYVFARAVYQDFATPNGIPFFITPGNHTPPSRLSANHKDEITGDGEIDLDGIRRRTEWLIERCRRDGFSEAAIIPQMHTLLWHNRQGV